MDGSLQYIDTNKEYTTSYISNNSSVLTRLYNSFADYLISILLH